MGKPRDEKTSVRFLVHMWPVRCTDATSMTECGSKTQQHPNVLFTCCSEDGKQILRQSIIFHQKRPFTVNCLAAVAVIHKLVKMTVHFCLRDTRKLQSATPNYPLGTSGKCRPQISTVLRCVYETTARGKKEEKQWEGLCRLQEKAAVREMADWLKPCQHICVALATVNRSEAVHWIQMLEKLWRARAMPIPFKEQVLFLWIYGP